MTINFDRRTVSASQLLALLVLGICTVPVHAQERHPGADVHYWTKVGVFYPDYKFTARADVAGGIALPDTTEEINYDAALDITDRKPVFWAEVGWRFSEKWLIAAQYFSVNRSNSATLDEQIEFEDVIYDVGATISAGTETSITRFFLSRNFIDNGPHELQLGAGFHWLAVSAFIEGEGQVNNMASEFHHREASSSAPLPNLGALYTYSPSKKWLYTLRTDWLAASFGKYDGSIVNLLGGVNYAVNEHFGIALNYQYFRINAGVDDDNWQGSVAAIYTGPVLYLSGYW